MCCFWWSVGCGRNPVNIIRSRLTLFKWAVTNGGSSGIWTQDLSSERGDSWCTDSSFSPLLVNLSQVFESSLLDSILKLAVIPVACAPFPTQILPSSQLCIQYALIQHSVNSHTFQ